MYILALLIFQYIYHSHVVIPFHSAIPTDFHTTFLLLFLSDSQEFYLEQRSTQTCPCVNSAGLGTEQCQGDLMKCF